jgi:hypothetical protein
VYYWLWIYLIPKIKGYRIRQEVLDVGEGAQSHRLVKVPAAEVKAWDSAHDASGRPLDARNSQDDLFTTKKIDEKVDLEKS